MVVRELFSSKSQGIEIEIPNFTEVKISLVLSLTLSVVRDNEKGINLDKVSDLEDCVTDV